MNHRLDELPNWTRNRHRQLLNPRKQLAKFNEIARRTTKKEEE